MSAIIPRFPLSYWCFITARATVAFFLLLLLAATAVAQCPLNPTSPSVTICAPASGASVTSPVQIIAGTTDTAHSVITLKIYLDFNSTAVFSASSGSLNTTIAMSTGSHHITVKAWDSSGASFSAAESFTVVAAGTVVVSPSSATLQQGAQQPYSATENGNAITATWAVSGNLGSFSGNVFTAGATASGSGTITATAPDGSKGSTSVTVAPVVVTPNPATVVQGETQQFSATVSPVTWSVSGNVGTIDPKTGVFTASSSSTGNVVVTATNGSGGQGTANLSVVALAISPNSANVAEGQKQTFTANAPVTWSATGDGGIVAGSGGSCPAATCAVFTAGSSTGKATVTATEANTGAVANAAVTVTTGIPTPPANAIVFSNVQETKPTGVCDKSCAGGSNNGSDFFALNQTTPSLSGQSIEVEAQGAGFNSMWYWHFGAHDTITNMLNKMDLFLASNSGVQALEYDPQFDLNGFQYSMSIQCEYTAHIWRLWNSGGTGTRGWFATNIPCPAWTTNTWHHVEIYTTLQPATHSYTFVAMSVDGVVYQLNQTFVAINRGFSDNIGTQVQIDVNRTGGPVHEWIDNLSLTVW